MEVFQIPAFQDNYIYVLRGKNGTIAAVDPGDPAVVEDFLGRQGWASLDLLLVTHHHPDHVGGNLFLKERYGCRIFGSAADRARIPGLDQGWEPGSSFSFDGERVEVLGCDGHTLGHISYWFPESQALFCGDTIFSLGCGRLFEGTAAQMWESLSRLRSLPDDTLVYCAHEYTLENAAFALVAEPGNSRLKARVTEAETLVRGGIPTVPSKMGDEKAANPFLRPESAELQRFVGKEGEIPLAEVFGAIREKKDRFDQGLS